MIFFQKLLSLWFTEFLCPSVMANSSSSSFCRAVSFSGILTLHFTNKSPLLPRCKPGMILSVDNLWTGMSIHTIDLAVARRAFVFRCSTKTEFSGVMRYRLGKRGDLSLLPVVEETD